MKEYDARLTDRVRTRGPLSADDAACFFLPIAESLAALHAREISHGAVSPRAIHVDSYGHATLLDSADVPVDAAFVAPDPTWGLRPELGTGASGDVWSFAALVLYATTGEPPVPDAPLPRAAGWLRPLLHRAMRQDPRQRPPMSEVVTFLRAQVADPDIAAERATLPVPLHDLVESPQPEPLTPLAPMVQSAAAPLAPADVQVAAVAPAAPTRAGKRRAERERGYWLLWTCGAVIIALALLGVVLLLAGGDDERRANDDAAAATTTSATAVRNSPSETTEATASAVPVTARGLERFARNYVATAHRDPDSGFDMLAKSYQQASPHYRDVWAAIDAPRILSVSGDPDALAVSYTYTYRYNGVARTEDVTLQLVRRGARLLIAGATAHLH